MFGAARIRSFRTLGIRMRIRPLLKEYNFGHFTPTETEKSTQDKNTCVVRIHKTGDVCKKKNNYNLILDVRVDRCAVINKIIYYR